MNTVVIALDEPYDLSLDDPVVTGDSAYTVSEDQLPLAFYVRGADLESNDKLVLEECGSGSTEILLVDTHVTADVFIQATLDKYPDVSSGGVNMELVLRRGDGAGNTKDYAIASSHGDVDKIQVVFPGSASQQS